MTLPFRIVGCLLLRPTQRGYGGFGRRASCVPNAGA